MSQAKIRALLEGRLKAWADTQGLAVHWQNVMLPQPAGTYLQCFLLPAPTVSEDLQGAHRSFTGIFQVSVVTERGLGSGSGESIAESLSALFPNNLRLTGSGLTVQIISPVSCGRPEQEPDCYYLPVSFTYRADLI